MDSTPRRLYPLYQQQVSSQQSMRAVNSNNIHRRSEGKENTIDFWENPSSPGIGSAAASNNMSNLDRSSSCVKRLTSATPSAFNNNYCSAASASPYSPLPFSLNLAAVNRAPSTASALSPLMHAASPSNVVNDPPQVSSPACRPRPAAAFDVTDDASPRQMGGSSSDPMISARSLQLYDAHLQLDRMMDLVCQQASVEKQRPVDRHECGDGVTNHSDLLALMMPDPLQSSRRRQRGAKSPVEEQRGTTPSRASSSAKYVVLLPPSPTRSADSVADSEDVGGAVSCIGMRPKASSSSHTGNATHNSNDNNSTMDQLAKTPRQLLLRFASRWSTSSASSKVLLVTVAVSIVLIIIVLASVLTAVA